MGEGDAMLGNGWFDVLANGEVILADGWFGLFASFGVDCS